MNRNLTLGSLFDGSGGFPLGAVLNGITPLWASEIEPFPIRVTTKRFPNMKHLGDISKLNGAELEPVDIITFGSPCTDLSVAGKRAGLDGKQSSLFHEAIRVIREMRCKTNGQYPRYIVWENVPGAFSSCKGEDFRCVLEEITKTADETYTVPMPEKGKWLYAGEIMGDNFSIAWRTFDAQFWGVPQRRRRIYLVADFGGFSASKILFESESVFGNTPKSRKPWKRTSEDAEGCPYNAVSFEPGAMSRLGAKPSTELSGTIRAQMGDNQTCVAIENHPNDSRVKIDTSGTVQTITGRAGTGGGNVPMVMSAEEIHPKTLKIRCGCEGGGKGALVQDDKSATLSCNNDQTVFQPTVFGISAKDSNAMKSANPNSGIYKADTSRTLDANGGNPGCNQGGMAVVCVDQGGGKSSCNVSENISPTLSCTHGGEPAVCVQSSMIGRKDKNGPNGSGVKEGVSFTLNTVDKHAVAYGIDRAAFNQGQNALYNFAVEEDLEPTIVAKGPGAVAAPTYCSSKASFFTIAEKEKANTLVATDYKDPPVINDYMDVKYAVRRLTPLECSRLQGFPDWWCCGLETEEPTDEDIRFWTDVFETHRKIIGTSQKPKTEKQIVKWLKNPYADSSEYKMWGNGVALPCVFYVMCGIRHCSLSHEDCTNE